MDPLIIALHYEGPLVLADTQFFTSVDLTDRTVVPVWERIEKFMSEKGFKKLVNETPISGLPDTTFYKKHIPEYSGDENYELYVLFELHGAKELK